MAPVFSSQAALIQPQHRQTQFTGQHLCRRGSRRAFTPCQPRKHACSTRTRDVAAGAAALDVELATLSAHALHASGQAQAILDRTGVLISEYRSYKAALGGWLADFQRLHKRQPGLVDAEGTGDTTLISRFQQYLMIRKRLLAELPYLRQQLATTLAASGSSSGDTSTNSSSNKAGGRTNSGRSGTSPVNANSSLGGRDVPAAAAQVYSALEYKRTHPQPHPNTAAAAAAEEAVAAAAALPAAVVGSSSSSSTLTAPVAAGQEHGSLPTIVSVSATPEAGPLAAAPRPSVSAANADVPSSSSSSSPLVAAPATDAKLGHLVGSVTTSADTSVTSSSGGSRVTSAALAALEYKKQKAAGKARPAAGHRATGPALAVLQAPVPAQPSAAAAAGLGAQPDVTPPAAAGAAGAAAAPAGVVETARFAVASGRQQIGVPEDERLDVLLQGVPGGLGAAVSLQSTAAAAAAAAVQSSSSSTSNGVVSSSAAAQPATSATAAVGRVEAVSAPAPTAAAPAATIITAKFDVNAVGPSLRTRRLAEAADQLDPYLAGLAQASTALAVEQGLISPQGQPQQQQPQQQQDKEKEEQQQVAVANGQQQQQTAAKELVVAAAAGAGVKAGTPAKVPAAARSSSSSSRVATLAPGQQQQQRPARLPEFSLEAPPDALPVPT